MDELVNILDEKGNYTGKTAMKSKAHQLGLFHATVHVWFYTNDGNILIQQRAECKETFPLLWDVSVAGHVAAGEKIKTSAIREITEEIGVNIEISELEEIGVFKSVLKFNEHFIDAEFHHIFFCRLTTSLTALKKQQSEVNALKLVSFKNFRKQIITENTEQYVPHGISYYKMIISELEKRLECLE